MKCKNCGEEVNENWKMCPFCGSQIEKKLVCKKCGNELQPSWSMCPICGQSTVEDDEGVLPSIDDNPSPDLDTIPSTDEDFGLDANLYSNEDFDLVAGDIAEAEQRQKEQENAEYQKKLTLARVACIRKNYEEAKNIYEELIAANAEDVNAYIGLVRIVSQNYTNFEGAKIDEAINVAKQVSMKDDLSKFDKDFAAYMAKRKAHFDAIAEAKRKAKEDADRRAREAEEQRRKEAERKAKEQAEREAEKARLIAIEEARLKAEEDARLKAEEEARLKAEQERKRKEKEKRLAAEAEKEKAYNEILSKYKNAQDCQSNGDIEQEYDLLHQVISDIKKLGSFKDSNDYRAAAEERLREISNDVIQIRSKREKKRLAAEKRSIVIMYLVEWLLIAVDAFILGLAHRINYCFALIILPLDIIVNLILNKAIIKKYSPKPDGAVMSTLFFVIIYIVLVMCAIPTMGHTDVLFDYSKSGGINILWNILITLAEIIVLGLCKMASTVCGLEMGKNNKY